MKSRKGRKGGATNSNRARLVFPVWLALVVGALFASHDAAADFQSANTAFQRQDFAGALSEWLPLAQKGDVNAQFNVGVILLNGMAGRRDTAQAALWFRRAAELGLAPAAGALGLLLVKGDGVPRDVAAGLRFLETAAAGNDFDALMILGDLYAAGREVTPNIGRAGVSYDRAVTVAPNPLARERAQAKRAALRQLEAGSEASRQKPQSGATISWGAGFAIGKAGEVVTANHVVKECLRVSLDQAGQREATVAVRDASNDLALLHGPPGWSARATARLRPSRELATGDGVFIAGYGGASELSGLPKLSPAVVAGPVGVANDSRFLRLQGEAHPGNSGGPLLDSQGAVIGLVDAGLNERGRARLGEAGKDMFFAIKSEIVQLFLEAHSPQTLRAQGITGGGMDFTVPVVCWR